MLVPIRSRTGTADVFPDFSGVGGSGNLAGILGALLSAVLILAVLMVIVCAATWAISGALGNYQAAGRARTGLWVAIGSAVLAGAGVTWANFLIGIGARL